MTGRASARAAAPLRGAASTSRTSTPRASTSRTSTPRTSTPRTSTPRVATSRPSARTTARPVPRSTPARPELRVVPTAAPARPRRSAPGIRSRRAPFVLLVLALLVGTTLGLLILNTAIAVDSLKATQLQAENAKRAEEVQRLQQQVINASAPAELARNAVAAGLVPAGPVAYLVLEGGGTILRGTPAPATSPTPPTTAGSGG